VNHAGIGRRGNRFDPIGQGEVVHSTFKTHNSPLDGAGHLTEDVAIGWPVGGEIRGARQKAIARGGNDGNEQKHHDEGADGARDPHAFQELDGRIEEVCQENGQQDGNDHAGGVIKEQQNDRSSQDFQAEG